MNLLFVSTLFDFPKAFENSMTFARPLTTSSDRSCCVCLAITEFQTMFVKKCIWHTVVPILQSRRRRNIRWISSQRKCSARGHLRLFFSICHCARLRLHYDPSAITAILRGEGQRVRLCRWHRRTGTILRKRLNSSGLARPDSKDVDVHINNTKTKLTTVNNPDASLQLDGLARTLVWLKKKKTRNNNSNNKRQTNKNINCRKRKIWKVSFITSTKGATV